MRIIKIKVYKLDELCEAAQELAILKEAKRFNDTFSDTWKGYFNPHEIEAARERIIKFKREFTINGEVFNKPL